VRSRVAGRHHDPGGVQVVDLDHSTWGSLEAERSAIAAHRVNVLIQGTSPFITATLAVLRKDLHHGEFTWPDRPTAGNTSSATVLVQEIEELSPNALDALAQLIAETTSRVQVIATSSVVLYELVERGQFPADLYYRLNIVVLTDEGYAVAGQAPSA
jgi:hypothetical protein